MRNLLKILLLAVIYFWDCLKGRSQAYGLVLMYHSVENTAWKYGVSPKVFAKQIAYLSSYYEVVRLSRIIDYATGKVDSKGPIVAVTLDDGYLDTYTEVWPVLKKHGVSATVFLTTNLVEMPALGNHKRPTKEQLREMSESGLVNFEVHGRDHLNWSSLDTKSPEFDAEVLGCKEDIYSYTGQQAACVAYPAGNRSQEVQDRLKGMGFVAGFGITEGIIKPGDDLFALRRVQVDRSMSFSLFKLRLTASIDTYHRLINFTKGLYLRR